MPGAHLSSITNRLKNLFVASLFVGTQLVFPLAMSDMAHAATLASTDVSISSTGFVISNSSSYSVVAGQPTGKGQFKNGNVSSYPEGSCIPAVFDVKNTSSSAGDTLVTPVYDYYNGVVGVSNYELVTYNGNAESGVNNLNQLTYTGNSLSAAHSFPIVSGGTGSVTAVVSGPYAGKDTTITNPSSTDAFRHYNVSLSNVPAGATVQIQLCARLGLDASQYSGGSSLSLRTVQGGAENIPIPVNQILILPSITINKSVVGGTATASDFSFTLNPDVNGHTGSYAIPSGQTSVTIPNVNPDGSYTVTESGASNYLFTSGSGTNCTANATTLNTAAGAMTASVAAGNPNPTNATCTFTNTFQNPKLTLKKIVVNNSGGTVAANQWTLTAQHGTDTPLINQAGTLNGDGSASTATVTAQAGVAYSLSESGPSGYSASDWSCSGGTYSSVNKTITLGGGDNVTCTITNSNIAPTLTLKKVAINDNGGTQEANQWTLKAQHGTDAAVINATGTLSGNSTVASSTATTTTTPVVAGVAYSLSESGPAGYTASDWSCDGGTLSGGSITLALNTNVTCTITNNDNAPSLTLVKQVVNTNGGKRTASEWTLSATGASASPTNISGAGGATSGSGFKADTYTLNETGPTDYSASAWSCTNGVTVTNNQITLGLGQTTTCTITNTAIAPTLTLVKHVSGGTAQATDWTLSAVGPTSISGSTGGSAVTNATVPAGDYTLSESGGPTGYTASGWDCTAGSLNGNVLTLPLAANATCTITNVRDTGTLSVTKLLVPSSDTGLFNLTISGPTNDTATNQGNNGTTGNQTVDTGSYTVSETAGTNTTLSDYSSTYLCSNGVSGSGTTSTSFTISKGESVNCTFTNTRYGSISGTKYVVNADGTHVGTLQNWTIYLLVNGQQISHTVTDANGNYSFGNLLPGNYTVQEDTSNTSYTQLYGWQGSTCSLQTYNLDLTAGGVNSTANDFCNFQNASISGYKFNDLNGNGQYDNGEPKLSGWTIFLDTNNNGQYDNGEPTQVTGNNGSYTFSNLSPGTYHVCEEAQTGWVEITSPACQTVDITDSGQAATAVFGNQGRGSIQVKKNVTDENGVTTDSVAGWTTWNLSGNYNDSSTGNAMGDTVSNTPADTYTIQEVQKDNYHFVSVDCTDNGQSIRVDQAESTTVTLNPGDAIVCIYTDARDTGTLTVNKTLVPSKDSGKFNLNINGQTYASNVGDGGTTNAVTVATGSYTVSETGGTNTNLSDYSSAYTCTDGDAVVANGSGTSISNVPVAYGHNVVCTFTNTRLATLTIVKDANPNSSQSFDFQFGVNQIGNLNELLNANSSTDFSLVDDGTNTQNSKTLSDLATDTTYYVTESSVSGWDLTNIDCGKGVQFGQNGSTMTITLAAGDNVTCTFTNTERGSITIVKDAQPDSTQSFTFTGNLEGDNSPNFSLTDDGTNDGLNSKQFSNLTTGTYTVTEPSVKDWSLESITCVGGSDYNTNERNVVINLQPGENVTCTFVNTRDTGTITVNKTLLPSSDSGRFNLNINGQDSSYSYTATNQGDGGTTGAQTVDTGTYSVSETGYNSTDLSNYYSTYECTDGEAIVTTGVGTSASNLSVAKGHDIVCTFTNARLANIVVTKYNDLNRNGTYDSTTETSGLNIPEPTLPGWDMTLAQVDSENSTTQTTGNDGTTTFTSVVPGQEYVLDETLQTGWNRSIVSDSGSNIYCVYPGDQVGYVEDSQYIVEPGPGETVHCYVGNYQSPALNITKSNNATGPMTPGSTVTYSIKVSVPKDSGAVFGATVTDLPPANFHVVANSWTASSSDPAHNVALDVLLGGGPNYGSPGVWSLGNLIPGEVVTLTYQAIIGTNVSNGTYPDTAYTQAYSVPNHEGDPDVTGGCFDSSCLAALGDPFVFSQVNVISTLPPASFTAGQVLGASVLVNTGTNLLAMQFILPVVLVAGVYLVRRVNRAPEKGGK